MDLSDKVLIRVRCDRPDLPNFSEIFNRFKHNYKEYLYHLVMKHFTPSKSNSWSSVEGNPRYAERRE